jgi:hypothetical protein
VYDQRIAELERELARLRIALEVAQRGWEDADKRTESVLERIREKEARECGMREALERIAACSKWCIPSLASIVDQCGGIAEAALASSGPCPHEAELCMARQTLEQISKTYDAKEFPDPVATINFVWLRAEECLDALHLKCSHEAEAERLRKLCGEAADHVDGCYEHYARLVISLCSMAKGGKG